MTVYMGGEACRTMRVWLLPNYSQVDQGRQVSGGGGGGCGEVTTRGLSKTGKAIYLQILWGCIMSCLV